MDYKDELREIIKQQEKPPLPLGRFCIFSDAHGFHFTVSPPQAPKGLGELELMTWMLDALRWVIARLEYEEAKEAERHHALDDNTDNDNAK